MIDNFEKIKTILDFKPNTFYVFIALQRAKDFTEEERKQIPLITSDKQRMLKYWLVDSEETLTRYMPEMKYYCTALKGRLYMCTDVKSAKKASVCLSRKINDCLYTQVFNAQEAPLSIKTFTSSMPLSVVESSECSVHGSKYWLVDIDIKDEHLLSFLSANVKDQLACVLETANGYHMLIKKVLSKDDIEHRIFYALAAPENTLIEIKDNALTLVFLP